MKNHLFMYLKATNLYSHSMFQRLPISDVRWLSEYGIDNFDLKSILSETDYGVVLKAAIEYPSTFHDSHSDLRFLVENIVPPITKQSKLIPSSEKFRIGNFIFFFSITCRFSRFGFTVIQSQSLVSMAVWMLLANGLSGWMANFQRYPVFAVKMKKRKVLLADAHGNWRKLTENPRKIDILSITQKGLKIVEPQKLCWNGIYMFFLKNAFFTR